MTFRLLNRFIIIKKARKNQTVSALGNLGVDIDKLPIECEGKNKYQAFARMLYFAMYDVCLLIWYKWFMNKHWRNSEYGANNSVKKNWLAIAALPWFLVSVACSGMWALCTYYIVTHAWLCTAHTQTHARTLTKTYYETGVYWIRSQFHIFNRITNQFCL